MDIELKITELLSRMTVEEKVGQLNQLPLMQDTSVLEEEIRLSRVGSIVLAYTPFAGRENREDFWAPRVELDRIAREESRLGIPLLLGRDVIHGHHTIFPIPLGQAASWNPERIEKASAIAAYEAREEYVDWTFSPMVDIARDPRWGRIVEGYGEDPYLSSICSAHAVRGYQQSGQFSACVKHFLGYGASEGGRDYSGADISPSALRNIYLPSFKAAIDAGVDTVMASFNDVNGIPVTGSQMLLTKLLKEELGFQGFVVSDWDAVGQLVIQGVAKDRKDAARIAFMAGIDMDMCSGCFMDYLPELIHEGVCDEERLDDAVRRILRVKFKIRDKKMEHKVSYSHAEARNTAYELARDSIVMLKNEDAILPLAGDEKIALIGEFAKEKRSHLGCWTLDGCEDDVISIVEGLKGRREIEICPTNDFKQAEEAASRADVAVVVIGEHWDATGEARGKSSLKFSFAETWLVKAVSMKCKKTVVVVCSGRPMCLSEIDSSAQSILYAWHGGVEAGNAIAAVLCGEHSPSGKLPVSLPFSVGQIPIYYNQRPAGRDIDDYYGKGQITSYQNEPARPFYPFGHGLSYGEIEYVSVTTEKEVYKKDEVVCLTAEVKNIGSMVVDEVCQCYIRSTVSSVVRPLKELKGFQRVRIEPGETVTVTFLLTEAELQYMDESGVPVQDSGLFIAWIGGSCYAEQSTSFFIES